GAVRRAAQSVAAALGAPPAPFAERAFAAVEARRERMWVERMKTLDWELFDHAPRLMNELLIDGLARSAVGTSLATATPQAAEAQKLRDELTSAFASSLFLWHKSKDDLVTEMDSELQMPGWGNVWTQPIINRVNMLATGVRTQIGVKVFGPTGKPLPEAMADIQRVSEQIAERLRTVRGAVDVTADQAVGKRYVEVEIKRDKAALYGVNVADVNQAVETAIGGSTATTTVEGRMRFPVRVRYAREYWQDADAIANVLVAGTATPPELMTGRLSTATGGGAPPAKPSAGNGRMGSAMGRTAGAMGRSSGAGGGMAGGGGGTNGLPSAAPLSTGGTILIPLSTVADVRVVEGPSMIKSENGRLRNYVTLNVRDRDVVGFVDEARQAIRSIESELAGTGMTVEWTGEFENQLRARRTLTVIVPMVLVLILLLLYLTFGDMLDTLLIFLAVAGALAGSVMFQALFGFNFSVIVSIGYIAALGMATETGVIMLVYLREAIDRKGGLEKIESLEELRATVMSGAVHRLRPKLLTEGTAVLGLVPMLWATGTGAEIMRPMAAPVLGGLLISDEVIDLMIPVLFYHLRKRRWLKLHAGASRVAEESVGSNGNGHRPDLATA
ncbi:MAG TPA: efflux RND transporter permease subunit, partial [Tepidisphaeraceae bacterium]|nr:efflux RND transporter permease subunit [Tepidisphaeraceae bacterium]